MQQPITSNKTNPVEILFDLKTILSDFYVATFDLNGKNLKVKFVNGQQFVVTVKEIAELP